MEFSTACPLSTQNPLFARFRRVLFFIIIMIIIMGLTVDIHIVALTVHCIRIELEFGKCWFLRRGENRSTRRKSSRSREENQQQTQPTYDAETGNRTRATLVGGECSHHCATPAPLYLDESQTRGDTLSI